MSATHTSIPALLKQTYGTNAGFRLYGNQVQVIRASNLPAALYAELRGRCGELWDHLGGTVLDQPSLDLLAQLNVKVVTPRTINEACTLVAEIERDSDHCTPQMLLCRPGLLRLDIETAALPGTKSARRSSCARMAGRRRTNRR